MRKILVFSDLHANKDALDDILPLLGEASFSIFCGDLLGYGTDIDASIDFVLKKIDLVVLGNHERLAITNEDLSKQRPAVRESALYARSKLNSEQKKLLLSLPTQILYRDIYITHSIGDDYLRSEKDFLRLCKTMPKEAKYAFFGHTHEQIIFKHNGRTVVNPGSITKGRFGFPRGYAMLCGESVNLVPLEPIL